MSRALAWRRSPSPLLCGNPAELKAAQLHARGTPVVIPDSSSFCATYQTTTPIPAPNAAPLSNTVTGESPSLPSAPKPTGAEPTRAPVATLDRLPILGALGRDTRPVPRAPPFEDLPLGLMQALSCLSHEAPASGAVTPHQARTQQAPRAARGSLARARLEATGRVAAGTYPPRIQVRHRFPR